jgi:hypothetical protein
MDLEPSPSGEKSSSIGTCRAYSFVDTLCMKCLATLLPLTLATTLALAQTSTPVNVQDADPEFAASTNRDWHALPPTFQLQPATPGARTGQIWVRKVPEGLLIAGHVDGSPPDFPTSVADLTTKDHVEIWLAQQPNPAFPPIGWGEQHGDYEFPKGENSCEENVEALPSNDQIVGECKQWVRQQIRFRRKLRRLFVRQWDLAPNVGAETFASIAYATIAKNVIHDLKPDGVPALTVQTATVGGYDFETLISWQMFPPLNTTRVQDLYLVVRVFGPSRPSEKHLRYSSTVLPSHHEPARRNDSEQLHRAVFSGSDHIRLEHPREYTITPCHYDVIGKGSSTIP